MRCPPWIQKTISVTLMPARQQRRITPRRGCIHRHRLLRAKTVQIVRAARFGAGAAQAFAPKGLHTHHCANHVTVDVDVADMGGGG